MAVPLEDFDYGSAAELFALKRKKHGPVAYRRFDNAAEAIRYAIESLSRPLLDGTIIETDTDRLDGRTIQKLYSGSRYPLKRNSIRRAPVIPPATGASGERR